MTLTDWCRKSSKGFDFDGMHLGVCRALITADMPAQDAFQFVAETAQDKTIHGNPSLDLGDAEHVRGGSAVLSVAPPNTQARDSDGQLPTP